MIRGFKVIGLALLIFIGGVFVIGQVLSSIGWCTGFFPDTVSNCSAAPFFALQLEVIHSLYVMVTVLGVLIGIPLAVISIPIILIVKGIRHSRQPKV